MERQRRLESLFVAHNLELWRFASRRIGPVVADDVVCETFLVAWRRLDEVPAGAERPWLYSTARYVIANEHRSHRRRAALVARVAPLQELQVAVGDVAEAVVERDAVARALAAVSPGDQEVLRLSEWEELTDREAAEVLGCSRSAYRLRLHRARRRFTATLEAADRLPLERAQPHQAVMDPAVLDREVMS